MRLSIDRETLLKGVGGLWEWWIAGYDAHPGKFSPADR